jgi:uncharacterized protein YjbJ (UPF0337 family)
MDKQRVKGAVDEAVGSAKRAVGGLTGNRHTQAEGLIQQGKGKVETAVGKLKDKVRDAKACAASPCEHKQEVEREHRAVINAENRNLL